MQTQHVNTKTVNSYIMNTHVLYKYFCLDFNEKIYIN